MDLRELNAVVLLDKPAGCTSNAVLQQVRKIFRAKKAGHTGSLDPAATGMLPICFGEGTKLCGYLLDAEKTYEAEGLLGAVTDTDDAQGQTIQEAAVPAISESQMQAAVNGFLGDSMQRPPVYSAIKRNGVRAHKLARRGETPELDERPITVHEIELLNFDGMRFNIRMRVSKGTINHPRHRRAIRLRCPCNYSAPTERVAVWQPHDVQRRRAPATYR